MNSQLEQHHITGSSAERAIKMPNSLADELEVHRPIDLPQQMVVGTYHLLDCYKLHSS